MPKIYIKRVKRVSPDFHARYDAKKKIYRYIILREPSPFLDDYGYSYFGKVSQVRMRHASKFLIGKHNFRSFCDNAKNGENGGRPHFLRTIDRITISHNLPPAYRGRSNKVLSVDIEGRSFLCHMVRIIAGTLLEVGMGKMSLEDFRKILEAKDRALAGKTLPARGLFLMKVCY